MEANKLFSWIDPIRKIKVFQIGYLLLKFTMGLTFILSGLRKMPGVKFTILSIDNPVGAYFQAMYDTGFYWNFIGYFQIILGILLLFRRFGVIVPLLMMPVTINIFMVSIGLNMRGTPVITTLMLLGNIALILWHYEKYLPLLIKPAM
jgi:hypothetical protein